MGHDIYFVRRDPGQSFDEALEQTEEAYEGDPGPLTAAELEQWDEVLPHVREVLGDVEVFGDEATRELTHAKTGIELTLFNGEITIHVPQEDPDPDVLSTVQGLALAVERATGLEGYDSRLGAPVSGPEGSAGPSHRESTEGSDDWDDDWDDGAESDGTSTTLPAFRRPVDDDGEPTSASPRRWWEFWRA